jgi:hypothetical protein
VRTFFEMRFAVGRLGWMRWKAWVRPTADMFVSTAWREGESGRTRNGDGENEEEIDVEELRRHCQ